MESGERADEPAAAAAGRQEAGPRPPQAWHRRPTQGRHQLTAVEQPAASAGSAGPSGPASEREGMAAGTWLELSVAVDQEAVEAVSEILSRVAPGGVSVEVPFTLIDEGLAATPEPDGPATLRAYIPALDPAAAQAAIDQVTRDLGHLQAFGLRPIGELVVQPVHEEDWAAAWKQHFPVLRVGKRLVIRPDVAASSRPAG